MELADTIEEVAAPNGGAPPEPPGEWRFDKQGRAYIPRRDGRGILYRRGENETVAEALARPAGGEKRPRRKTKAPRMPDAPRVADLKELEAALAEALKSPALLAATAGDEWTADHFTAAGPYLARNLILASQHNPWLRKKLEEAATGQDAMMKVVSMIGVGGALFIYVVPPVIYWFNLPAPESARKRFGIPPRREHDRPAEDANAGTPPAAAAESEPGAFAA